MLSLTDLRDVIVRPVLERLNLYSPSAERLLLGTALTESGCAFLRQNGGPALGLFQMEPATHDDIFAAFLAFRPALKAGVEALAAPWPRGAAQLATNPAYAAALCRLSYLRAPPSLPKPEAADGMATYWKTFYNTPLGRGDPARFRALYTGRVLPLYAKES
jgi:hypothetical protein